MNASAPPHWSDIPLRYLCKLNPSVSFDGLTGEDEVTYLPMDRVKAGYFIPHVEEVSKYTASYNAFENGDIILAKVTPCFENGNIAIAESLTNERGFGSSELFVIRPVSIHARFLFYYFQSLTFKQEGEASMTGAGGLKRVSPDLLRQHRLCQPPLPEQMQIANYLDRETARIDALVAEKERMLALLEEKRAALISRVVTRGLNPQAPMKPSGLDWLGEIPEHWSVWRLKHLADVRGGIALGKNYSSNIVDEFPYLRVANVQDGYLDLQNIKTIELPQQEASNYLLKSGDVLMNEGGDIDKLGRGCIWTGEIAPCLHQNHVFAVRPHKVDPEWLTLWTSTAEAKRYFEMKAKRSTNLASISSSNIGELPILLPPASEQSQIKKFLDRHSGHAEAAQKQLRQSIELLRERRSALITAAITGQIPLEDMAA